MENNTANKTIQEIEKNLKIKLEPYEYEVREKNSYQIYSGRIHNLCLDNIDIKTLGNIKDVSGITIKNSTVYNLTELLKLNIYRLTLINVTFKTPTNSIIPNDFLHTLRVEETDLELLNFKKCINLKDISLSDSKINHIFSINSLPNLRSLNLNNILFEKNDRPFNTSTKNRLSLNLSNMAFDSIKFFLPFENVTNLYIDNCIIDSISDLYKFEKLSTLSTDSNTTIKNIEFLNISTKKISLWIHKKTEPINLEQYLSISHFVDELYLDGFREKKLDHIEAFKNIKELNFTKSDIYLDAFLPIAPQIESLNISESSLKKTNNLNLFTSLTKIHTNSDNLGIQDLKDLFPIKNQLKSFFSFGDETLNLQKIDQFTKLETLKIYSISPSLTLQILKITSLKNLYLHVYLEEEKENITKPVFNLKSLKNLERLNINLSDATFTDLDQLKSLKSLRIDNGTNEINSFSRMVQLERLNFEGEGAINISSDQFPNLKELRITGSDISLTLDIPTLEILEIPSIDTIEFLGKMPNLKRLHLPKTNKYDEIFKNTPNLTHLDFEDFQEDTLNVLKPLKKLEYLDLLENTVSDIKMLNSLSNLIEVNLCGLEELESQLDTPEKAVYLWINTIHFHVYKEDDLWI